MAAAPKSKRFIEIEEPAGRVFGVGDIHGCVTELKRLVDHVVKKNAFTEDDLLIFVGDYIDRGPRSKDVVDYLLKLREELPARLIFLKGNHEDMLLSFLGFDGTLGEGYLINGGLECLQSYDLTEPLERDELLELIPDDHLKFYRDLDRYVIVGNYVFAHAGLNPLRDLRFQLNDDLFWIRDEFIANMHYFKKTIVFGHTPFQDVLFHLPYKIGIDTGLVYGSSLTCIEVTEQVIYQIEREERKVKKFSFEDKGAVWPEIV